MPDQNIPKPRIAIFSDGYLPGSKGGGPIRSVDAIVKSLGKRYDFYIFTRDRDLGDEVPYKNLEQNIWLKADSCNVIYLSPDCWTLANLQRLIQNLSPHLLYLNSFFSTSYAQKIYFLKLTGKITGKVLMSPRGEFSPGALEIKSLKKSIYLNAYRLLYKPAIVNWLASTNYEKEDIERVLPTTSTIFVAENISTARTQESYLIRDEQNAEVTNLVFISRISPKKNLLFALRMLASYIEAANFSVYGPIEDSDYWKTCLDAAGQLPDNVKFQYKGTLEHGEVQETFAHYDIFLFPTFGENFGHVIAEALSSGCLVMTSTATPWDDLRQHDAGWTLELVEKEFLNGLYEYEALSQSQKTALRRRATEYVHSKFDQSGAAQKTATVFDTLIGAIQ